MPKEAIKMGGVAAVHALEALAGAVISECR